MTEAELRDFLSSQGLAGSRTALRELKGGYLNTVWRVDTGGRSLVAKEFAEPIYLINL